MLTTSIQFPKYIDVKNHDEYHTNALMLIGSKENNATYWRHGGCYRVSAKDENEKLIVDFPGQESLEYVECTEQQWKESNEDYACEEYSWRNF